jgi:hypothetical protein
MKWMLLLLVTTIIIISATSITLLQQQHYQTAKAFPCVGDSAKEYCTDTVMEQFRPKQISKPDRIWI